MGVPVAVKDIIDIEGRITTGGSKVWAGRVSPVTATLVERMLAAGMIVLGKTHTVEFAMGSFGTNRHMGTPWNPWDLETHRGPGGSSSGTAVAVAARMAPWGIGTDTGGSVRIPAGWNDLVGLKTTPGLVPMKLKSASYRMGAGPTWVHCAHWRTVVAVGVSLGAAYGTRLANLYPERVAARIFPSAGAAAYASWQ